MKHIIWNNTETHLDFIDRVKILFGSPIRVETKIETDKEVEVIASSSESTVKPQFKEWFKKPNREGYSHIETH